ncbi:hypothetical protein A7326_16645 [Stenotrophomonas maltophilia]|nr:hypothetical protein A7326_16645 [Stenotrophomonas maltophilia]
MAANATKTSEAMLHFIFLEIRFKKVSFLRWLLPNGSLYFSYRSIQRFLLPSRNHMVPNGVFKIS